jgi:hypothetical protein
MRRVWLLGVVGLSIVAVSCVQTPDFAKNTADVILRVTKVTGSPGSDDQEDGDFLFSDVAICEEVDGEIICSTVNDNAIIEFEVIPKNPTSSVTNEFNDVLLTNYRVRYTRSDGRNIEGVDVPYAISGSMATQIPAGGSGGAAIVVVRHTAKDEPPLNGLSSGGFQSMLTVTAHISISGKTTNGKNVSTETALEITFGDFANE